MVAWDGHAPHASSGQKLELCRYAGTAGSSIGRQVSPVTGKSSSTATVRLCNVMVHGQ